MCLLNSISSIISFIPFPQLFLLFPQLFLLFHNKIKRKDGTILEFSVHALMTVYLECPSAMVLVPPGELLYHWEAVMGHTTLPEMKLL